MRALVLALLLSATAQAQTLQTTTWDAHFERHSARWLPHWDARWLKALCWQESNFRPRAVSPAGARGMCQFMPATWSEARANLGVQDIYNPGQNIEAAAWYLHRQERIWTSPRPDWSRRELAMASYNAGAGNIIRAQRLCGGRDWPQIRQCLPQVTGHHHAETWAYVERIGRWYVILTLEPAQ